MKIYFMHETIAPHNVREVWYNAIYLPPVGSTIMLWGNEYVVKRIECDSEDTVTVIVGNLDVDTSSKTRLDGRSS